MKYKEGEKIKSYIEGTVIGYYEQLDCFEVIDMDGEICWIKAKYINGDPNRKLSLDFSERWVDKCLEKIV